MPKHQDNDSGRLLFVHARHYYSITHHGNNSIEFINHKDPNAVLKTTPDAVGLVLRRRETVLKLRIDKEPS